ncbi:MAG: hypothetical protein AAF317_21120 [Pseudomonadota bacterium]
MKHARGSRVSAMFCLWIAGLAHAQFDPDGDEQNAATWYARSAAAYGDANWTEFQLPMWPDDYFPRTAASDAADLRRLDPMFDLLVRATRRTAYEPQIRWDHTPGELADVPRAMYRMSNPLGVRAVWRASQGNQAGAVNDLRALADLARHQGTDGTRWGVMLSRSIVRSAWLNRDWMLKPCTFHQQTHPQF